MSEFGKRMSSLLAEIADAFWEREANLPNIPPKLSDAGFAGATKVFMAALMDQMWVKQEKENTSLKDRCEMAQYYEEAIKRLIKNATDINTYDFYNTKKK